LLLGGARCPWPPAPPAPPCFVYPYFLVAPPSLAVPPPQPGQLMKRGLAQYGLSAGQVFYAVIPCNIHEYISIDAEAGAWTGGAEFFSWKLLRIERPEFPVAGV
jgi:hypothetical protein